MTIANTDLFQQVLYSFTESAKWFVICFAIFLPLTKLFPGKSSQPLFRRDMVADATYWFLSPIFYRPFSIFFSIALLTFFYSPVDQYRLNTEGLAPINTLPVWLQAVILLLVTDFLQYWMHRLFHKNGLWRYHSIHHSPKNVDWLTSARFHPVNILVYSTFINALIFMLGFSPAAFGELFIFNTLYSPLVHANLNWTYGPFRYVLASPVFHRWHHTYVEEGGNKNFAPTFPFLDVMFGTFYMPKGIQPSIFGAPHDPIPDTFLGQIAYPFRIKRAAPRPPIKSE